VPLVDAVGKRAAQARLRARLRGRQARLLLVLPHRRLRRVLGPFRLLLPPRMGLPRSLDGSRSRRASALAMLARQRAAPTVPAAPGAGSSVGPPACLIA
jgi:hypothetical protein